MFYLSVFFMLTDAENAKIFICQPSVNMTNEASTALKCSFCIQMKLLALFTLWLLVFCILEICLRKVKQKYFAEGRNSRHSSCHFLAFFSLKMVELGHSQVQSFLKCHRKKAIGKDIKLYCHGIYTVNSTEYNSKLILELIHDAMIYHFQITFKVN